MFHVSFWPTLSGSWNTIVVVNTCCCQYWELWLLLSFFFFTICEWIIFFFLQLGDVGQIMKPKFNFAEKIASLNLQDEELSLFAAAIILSGGILLTYIALRNHKKTSICDPFYHHITLHSWYQDGRTADPPRDILPPI